jgi:hypothetical protein
MGLATIGFDAHRARFCRQPIFEFFNDICHKQTSAR